MSEKKDQEYFSDGMAEEILNLLVKVPELKVIGRTSSFQFKGKTVDLRRIGAELSAVYVVAGSVRRSGDHVRVTAQLIDSRDGTQHWSETYDRNAEDVLKVQGEIAAGLVRALQLEVTAPGHLDAQRTLRSQEAYDAYLRGLHAQEHFDQSGLEEAIAYFRHAQDLDPSFAPFAEALALALRHQADWQFVPPKIGWQQTRAAAEATIKLDPRSALAHAILGNVYTAYDWNWPAAQEEIKTAVSLAPSEPTVMFCAALQALAVGQWTRSLHYFDAQVAADPLGPSGYAYRAWAYVRLDRPADAESGYRRALEISPTIAWTHYYLGVLLLVHGRADEALAEMQKEPYGAARTAGLAVAYHALHRTREADAALAHLEAEHATDLALAIAETYAFRGQKDRALQWLDTAYAQKDAAMYFIKGDPLFKPLEADLRYRAFLRKLNLPE